MSKGARITIAVATLICGPCFLLSGIAFGDELPAGPLPLIGMSAFCFMIALACLSRRSRPVTLPLIVAVLVTAWLLYDPNGLRNLMVFLATGVGGAVLLVGTMHLCVRWRDRHWFKAAKLARAGDVTAAIALLEQHLRSSGPSPRIYNNLAVLHTQQHNWSMAFRMAEEAERLGGPQPDVLSNKGLALWKLGHPEEGLTCLQAATRLQPDNLIIACNYGCVLADVGRAAEAAEILGRAEKLFDTQFVLAGKADRQARRQALDELRRKVSEVTHQT